MLSIRTEGDSVIPLVPTKRTNLRAGCHIPEDDVLADPSRGQPRIIWAECYAVHSNSVGCQDMTNALKAEIPDYYFPELPQASIVPSGLKARAETFDDLSMPIVGLPVCVFHNVIV